MAPRESEKSKSGSDEEMKGDKRDKDEDYDTEVIKIEDADAAFVLGRGGATKTKIAKVSGARLDLDEQNHTLEIAGTKDARHRARDYTNFVLAQRVGEVYISLKDERDDLSVVTVPEDCVGYVMGRGGQVLRQMEQEWGTLMFFAKVKDDDTAGEKLAIFGTRRARRGSELKVMSAVEHKHPGFYIDSDNQLRYPLKQPGDDLSGDDWGYDTYPLTDDEFSYALGANGSTRKKLAAAANCIMEYVGTVAVLAGQKDERKRARDYLDWLLAQRRGSCDVDTDGREDVTEVEMPRDSVGYVTGAKGEGLRKVERETDTFCFTEGSNREKRYERLLIFGHSRGNRKKAKEMVEDRIWESQNRGSRGKRSRSRDYDYGYSYRRSRSRSPSRGRSRSRSRSPSYSRDYDYDRRRR